VSQSTLGFSARSAVKLEDIVISRRRGGYRGGLLMLKKLKVPVDTLRKVIDKIVS
jgi:hypothetical protein